jgi:hypothetical protein
MWLFACSVVIELALSFLSGLLFVFGSTCFGAGAFKYFFQTIWRAA